MKTLTQLRIDHFRGIRDLNIEHLTSINVIVGDNNCGKTSVIGSYSVSTLGKSCKYLQHCQTCVIAR